MLLVGEQPGVDSQRLHAGDEALQVGLVLKVRLGLKLKSGVGDELDRFLAA